ncbi:hypothetical protein [Actinomadura welshii]|uniref:hypothetical protein n=1 Tax=Actinomadura welshii TaxID=3103817 RepID=UPI0003ACF62C|nr:hypothetical protein [Actinomadura madurae]
MTSPPPPARPRVRPVKLRLSGDDADVDLIADLITTHLPGLTADRIQAGETSAAYRNRRDSGCRRYVELYLLDEPATVRAEPAGPANAADGPRLALPAAAPASGRSRGGRPR